MRQAAVAAGALLRAPARLTGLDRESTAPHRWRLRLSEGEETCDWLVDATAGAARSRASSASKRQHFDRQIALVGWLVTDRADDVDATLTVETTSSGWWYGCRLPGQRRVAGFVTESGSTCTPGSRGCARPATWAGSSKDTASSARRSCALRTRRFSSAASARAAIAIGDAAVSYDPLASRGLVGALSSRLETVRCRGTGGRLAAWQADLEASFACYRVERARLHA